MMPSKKHTPYRMYFFMLICMMRYYQRLHRCKFLMLSFLTFFSYFSSFFSSVFGAVTLFKMAMVTLFYAIFLGFFGFINTSKKRKTP